MGVPFRLRLTLVFFNLYYVYFKAFADIYKQYIMIECKKIGYYISLVFLTSLFKINISYETFIDYIGCNKYLIF